MNRPGDDEVRQALEQGLTRLGRPGRVEALARRPSRYATSFPLEELDVVLDDGTELRLMLKDLTWDRLLDDARRTKPRFLYEPRRPIETYRRILAPEGLGATCFGAVADPGRQRYWLLLERVPGVELWQVGELETWQQVARWLARFHARFAGRVDELRSANPFLLVYDAELYRVWTDRAAKLLVERGVDERGRRAFDRVLEGYDAVVERLVTLPPTFVHGEFYPSNVMVAHVPTGLRVCPVDWEMAAIGPGLLDLAALIGGWEDHQRAVLASSYRAVLEAASPWSPDQEEFGRLLACCRLHLAVQWLGWSADWVPPPEHSQDWLGEALRLADELEV